MPAALVLAGLLELVTVPAPPASAQTSGSGTAAALAAEINATAEQVHQVNVQYQAALVRVSNLQSKTAAAQAAVASSSRQIALSRTALEREAVTAFVQIGGDSSQLLDILSRNPSTYEVGQVYLQATSGEVAGAEQSYETAKSRYSSERATLAGELRSARSAAANLASLDQSLQVTVDSESNELDQVQQMAPAVVADEAPAGSPAPQGLPTASGLVALASSPPPVVQSSLGGDFAELRQCESGGDYAADTGNGYYGAYQFSASTWSNLGFAGLPSNAAPATQDQAAMELQARSGWGQWPACSTALGLV